MRWLYVILSGVAFACSSTVAPRSGVTVFVTNGTCQAGSCASLQILGFPGKGPSTPGGPRAIDLGFLTTASNCFTFPPSATFRVIGVSNDGSRADTTTYTWTTADGLSLGTKPIGGPVGSAVASTSAFVPARAPGWSVALPGGSSVSPTQACVPLNVPGGQ